MTEPKNNMTMMDKTDLLSLLRLRLALPVLLLIFISLVMGHRALDMQTFIWINTGLPRSLPDAILPIWDAAMITLTNLGDTHVMLWIILLFSLPWLMSVGIRSREAMSGYWCAFVLVLLLATVFSQGLKELFNAMRPANVLPPESLHILGQTLRNYSFPSGHTVAAFSGMSILLPVLPASWRWGAFLLATGIGISRIGMGAHWPVDVAAGAFIGMVAGMSGWGAAKWMQRRAEEATIWKKILNAVAILGLGIMAANIAYTPFYELEYRSIRLCLISLGLLLALLFGYYRKIRTTKGE